MMYLPREDRAVNCFNKWCEGKENIYATIKRLTIHGILKYSL